MRFRSLYTVYTSIYNSGPYLIPSTLQLHSPGHVPKLDDEHDHHHEYLGPSQGDAGGRPINRARQMVNAMPCRAKELHVGGRTA